jgi:hypothetical protein
MATTAVSIAAATGVAAYLNGKYHLGQDIKMLRFRRRAGKYYEEIGMFLTSFRLDSVHFNSFVNSQQHSTEKTPIPLVLFCPSSRQIP